MKLTSKELFDLNIVDEIIEEPTGGAHRDREKTLEKVGFSIKKHLENFENLSDEEIILQRKNKFLQIGREGGFSSRSDTVSGLSLKKNNIDILLEKILSNKKTLIIVSLITIVISGLIYLL